MPRLGEVRNGREIGLGDGYHKYIWHACIDCGKGRWVHCVNDNNGGRKPRSLRCKVCYYHWRRAENNPNWKGGRYVDGNGYVMIKLQPNDFFYPMSLKNGYVFEHRLVVAKALRRNLHRWEIVHHKDNCPKDDNRYPETLQLVTRSNILKDIGGVNDG